MLTLAGHQRNVAIPARTGKPHITPGFSGWWRIYAGNEDWIPAKTRMDAMRYASAIPVRPREVQPKWVQSSFQAAQAPHLAQIAKVSDYYPQLYPQWGSI